MPGNKRKQSPTVFAKPVLPKKKAVSWAPKNVEVAPEKDETKAEYVEDKCDDAKPETVVIQINEDYTNVFLVPDEEVTPDFIHSAFSWDENRNLAAVTAARWEDEGKLANEKLGLECKNKEGKTIGQYVFFGGRYRVFAYQTYN